VAASRRTEKGSLGADRAEIPAVGYCAKLRELRELRLDLGDTGRYGHGLVNQHGSPPLLSRSAARSEVVEHCDVFVLDSSHPFDPATLVEPLEHRDTTFCPHSLEALRTEACLVGRALVTADANMPARRPPRSCAATNAAPSSSPRGRAACS